MLKAKDKDCASLLSTYVFGVNWNTVFVFFQLCSFSISITITAKKIQKYHHMTVEPIPNYNSVMIQLLYCYNSVLIPSLSFQPSQKQWHHQTFKRSCLTLQYFSVIVIEANAVLRTGRYCSCPFRPLRSVLSEDIVQTFCCIDSTPWRQIRAPLWRTTGEVDVLQQATEQPHSLRCAFHQTRIHD